MCQASAIKSRYCQNKYCAWGSRLILSLTVIGPLAFGQQFEVNSEFLIWNFYDISINMKFGTKAPVFNNPSSSTL